MEIAIASTVISVASLASLFSTCLDALDTVSSIARYGINHEILQVKVEVEKVRLLLWGQAVGLADDNGGINEALERQYMQNAVASLLVCFIKFVEDTEQLRERYGITEQPADAKMKDATLGESILGTTFKRTYDRFRNNPIKRQKQTSLFTKTKWAIKDESKFRSLIEELKGINDSLSSLLPGVKERARVQVRNQIMQSTNEKDLQNLVNASDDVNNFISEAASLRLDVLSGKGLAEGRPNVLQPAEQIVLPVRPVSVTKSPQIQQPSSVAKPDASATTQAEKVASSNPPATVPLRPVRRKPVALPPPYDNTGALAFHKVLIRENYPSFFTWMVGMEHVKVAYQPRPLLHPSFELFRISSKFVKHSRALLDIDPECDPEYEGWAPASVSLPGFAREIFCQARYGAPRDEKIWKRIKGTEAVSITDIIKRWNEIKQNGGNLESGWTKEKGYKEVRWMFGDSEYHWLDPNECYKLRHQITDLLASLSRDSIFPGFEKGSVGALALLRVMDPQEDYNMIDFTFQLLHAKELSLRLERDEGTVWHGGVTLKIIYDMIVADLFMKNFDFTINAEKFNYSITKETREQQRDAMVAFAERMKWPYLAEVQDSLDDFINGGDTKLDIRTWDWVAGLPLPGALFPVTLLFGLHLCCPSIKDSPPEGTVQIRDSSYGLTLPQASYWRSRSILGKVLAPLDGVHDIGGWVGPCPTPSNMTTPKVSTLMELKTRPLSFTMKGNIKEEAAINAAPSNPYDGAWEEALPPNPSQDTCELKLLRLTAVPSSNPDDNNPVKRYQAKLDFWFIEAKKLITMNLYTNSVFISVPPCQGTHRIDSRVKDIYARTTVELCNIDKAGLSPNTITVINARAGTGEVLARAWCAQTGTNAILWKRDSKCCFKCALMLASKEGLDINVLIIT